MSRYLYQSNDDHTRRCSTIEKVRLFYDRRFNKKQFERKRFAITGRHYRFKLSCRGCLNWFSW